MDGGDHLHFSNPMEHPATISTASHARTNINNVTRQEWQTRSSPSSEDQRTVSHTKHKHQSLPKSTPGKVRSGVKSLATSLFKTTTHSRKEKKQMVDGSKTSSQLDIHGVIHLHS